MRFNIFISSIYVHAYDETDSEILILRRKIVIFVNNMEILKVKKKKKK